MKRRTFAAGLALALWALVGLAGPATAGEQVPFHGRLDGVELVLAPPPNVILIGTGGGEASHLGRFEYNLDATVDFTQLPPLGDGYLTLTAANGDTLVADVLGISTPVIPGVLILIEEEALVVCGTGRFAGATGSFSITRLKYQDTGRTIGSFNGTISAPGSGSP
jgi:hypothetical protein